MNFSSRQILSAGGLAVLGLLAAGCASPGPPRAPSLHLPQRLTNVHAERQGGAVLVSFIAPLRSSDGELLTAPVFATLCRAVDAGPCAPTASFSGKLQVVGPVQWKDVLPPDLASGPDRLLTYRVELFTPRGRSAGPSEPAFAAAGPAPQPVQSLQVSGSRKGVLLRWTAESSVTGQVLLERDDLGILPPRPEKPASEKKKPLGPKSHVPATPLAPGKASAEQRVVWLQSDRTGADAGGMVDASARPGEPYRYKAVRSRKVSLHGKELELRSEMSAAVEVTMQDIYPPSIPRDLQVASFAPEGAPLAADLVWTPDTETDLAGYNVYREAATTGGSYGPRRKLNAALLALPAFHDATIAPGVGYRYTVTAVDRKGNESAASDAAELQPAP